jgi:predicted outer membrane protein
MKRLPFGTLALLACSALTPIVASAATGSADSSFVQTAQSEALGQFALASAAKGKTQDPALKALASQIADNADKANKFIAAYAKTHNVSVDNKPSLRATSQYGDITGLKGKDFDQTFAKDIKIDANIALSDYQDEAKNGSDPALRDFAKQQAAVLQQVVTAAEKAGS